MPTFFVFGRVYPPPPPPLPAAVLRRRFDSLKWDVKKCEDIVFDLQVSKAMDAFAQQQRAMFTRDATAVAHLCDGGGAIRAQLRRVVVTAYIVQVRGLGKAAATE